MEETRWNILRFFGVQQIDQAFDFGQLDFCARRSAGWRFVGPDTNLARAGPPWELALDGGGPFCSEVHSLPERRTAAHEGGPMIDEETAARGGG